MDRQIRLAACSLVRTRFLGRADLERQAASDIVALARLEVRLGLADESALLEAERAKAQTYLEHNADWSRVARTLLALPVPAREVEAARRYATATKSEFGRTDSDVCRHAAPRACAEIDSKRAARNAAREIVDPIAQRPSHYAARRSARKHLQALLKGSGFRTATHDHKTVINGAASGEERAVSESETEWASEAGMSNAYCKKAYRVAYSRHTWFVSTAILSPAVRELNADAPRGVVYLSETVRVRNGRGTSLVTETVSARCRTARAA
jgi:hypothetical protein